MLIFQITAIIFGIDDKYFINKPDSNLIVIKHGTFFTPFGEFI